jgi:coenzyme Q-binding protein COQ10
MVSDVKTYPEFLPWCVGARIYNSQEGRFDADLIIGYKMFKERFTSRVTVVDPTRVYVDYMRGPLKRLYNHWNFHPQEDGTCIVDFDVDLEFKSSFLENAIRRYFDEATRRMINCQMLKYSAVYFSCKLST